MKILLVNSFLILLTFLAKEVSAKIRFFEKKPYLPVSESNSSGVVGSCVLEQLLMWGSPPPTPSTQIVIYIMFFSRMVLYRN